MACTAIIIPTFNNPAYLFPCVESLLMNAETEDLFHIYIVNNGDAAEMELYKNHRYVTVLQQERNMGWEGGLKAGLAASTEPFVCFLNDDTFVPFHQRNWLNKMLAHFSYPDVGAVGPTSNVVMGKQQMFLPIRASIVETKFLIGFCLLTRRDILESVGGIDDQLPGGDDLDLSIRLRKAGKKLIIDRETFVYHHGFKTGEKVHGTANQIDGWNSIQKLEKTNMALIAKHGMRAFIDLYTEDPVPDGAMSPNWGSSEDELVKSFAIGDRVAEIGCGMKKLFPSSTGIDVVASGQEIPGLTPGRLSIADITANVEEPLPISGYDTIIAQHVAEHCVDVLGAFSSWRNALKHGGRLVIAVPDQTQRNTIPLNWEHRHAFTPQSLKRMMETLGMKTVDLLDAKNNVSFIGVFERNGV